MKAVIYFVMSIYWCYYEEDYKIINESNSNFYQGVYDAVEQDTALLNKYGSPIFLRDGNAYYFTIDENGDANLFPYPNINVKE
jgi:hypothetical protein